MNAGVTDGEMLPAFVCPCSHDGSLGNTYASVLVLGVDNVARTLAGMGTCAAVANTSSYCVRCRHITPSLNASRTMQENVMQWDPQHSFYVACAQFIKTCPKKTRGTRLRDRKQNKRLVEDASALA
jgi:hypothetical protein